MLKKKDRKIEINIDKWEISIPKHTHKELTTALIALASNIKENIVKEAIADIRIPQKLKLIETLRSKLCK